VSVPMFPLGSVVFPYTAVPLRVFEPRYQVLLDRVLELDASFGVVLIERGWEVGGGDARFSVGTLVRVVAVNTLPKTTDRAIVVAGFKRIRVTAWFPEDPFPLAEVVEFPDSENELKPDLKPALTALRRVLALASELGSDVSGIGLEVADDAVASSYQLAALCPISAFDSQRLLEASGPAERVELARVFLDERVELLRAQLSLS
jgi:Lon protease-like protein